MNLSERFAKLQEDLLQEGGPSISTIQNFRFAILRYAAAEEFAMRRHVQALIAALEGHGWMVLTLDLQAILLERIRAAGAGWAEAVIEQEKELVEFGVADDLPLHERAEDGLALLQQRIGALVEEEGGLAAACSELIAEHLVRHPAYRDRTLVLIGRAGVLYPFLRTSSILRQLDGHTQNLPVVLLYPGDRVGQTGLSFMGVLAPDNDYRPRIYG